jgi:hypothetical protein
MSTANPGGGTMSGRLLMALVCLAAASVAQTGNDYIIIDDTLHPDDAEAFASLFDCTMQLLGYSSIAFAASIREEGFGSIFYVLTVGSGTTTNFQQWYYTGSARDWDCIFAAINACAMVSAETDWHSDWLQLNFENVFVSYTTEDCRELFESLPGHSGQFIQDQLEEHAYIDEVRD